MVKYIKQLRKNQKGLTLVELLAVIVILGIVAAIAVPAVGSLINNARDDAHEANALMIINAAKLAEASGVELTGDGITVNELNSQGFLTSIPKDPENENQYGVNSAVRKAGTEYIIKLLRNNNSTAVFTGTDPTPNSDGEVSESQLLNISETPPGTLTIE